jgi:hypothetical protein
MPELHIESTEAVERITGEEGRKEPLPRYPVHQFHEQSECCFGI